MVIVAREEKENGWAGVEAVRVSFLGLSLVLLTVGAIGAVALGRSRDRLGVWLGSVMAVTACAMGVIISGWMLLVPGVAVSVRIPWSLPLGSFHLGLDGLSVFFLFAIFLISGLAAMYGIGYLLAHSPHTRQAPAVALFNLLVVAMVLVTLARDGVLFIMAWEIMFLASYFLVTYDSARREVRRAGFIYLVASHLGVVLLMLLFTVLASHTPGFEFDFDAFRQIKYPDPISSWAFLLALGAFGVKAGTWPLHLWLPEAHPAAPSHVSSVMSGVMIKMGIYGLLRTITLIGKEQAWWGILLVVLGIISGITGLLQALAQRDLKRLLAYSSIENVGIISTGIGLGLLGQTTGQETVATLGYTAALLHVLNHGLFKGLLFQAAGSVLVGTGRRNIDHLGGLIHRMPTTALAFAVGAVAVAGLPPLNGFVSESLLYVGAYQGMVQLSGRLAVVAVAILPTLALIGGLATAVFVKAFGLSFLGLPRVPLRSVREAPVLMRAAMAMGSLACLLIAVWPTAAFRLVQAPLGALVTSPWFPPSVVASLSRLGQLAGLLLGLSAVTAGLRFVVLRGRDVRPGPTWACGYAAPSSRMQYTAMSFPQPLLDAFPHLFTWRRRFQAPEGYFPRRAHREERLVDVTAERVIVPAVRRGLGALTALRVLQSGLLQAYLLYILMTLALLLGWQLTGGLR